MRLRDQAALTANALRNLALALESGTVDAAPKVLCQHAADLLAAAMTCTERLAAIRAEAGKMAHDKTCPCRFCLTCGMQRDLHIPAASNYWCNEAVLDPRYFIPGACSIESCARGRIIELATMEGE